MPRDLRDFIRTVRDTAPNEFVTVDRQVDPSWEVTALTRKLQDEGRYPMILFTDVKGSDHRLVVNAHATRRKLAAGLESTDTSPSELKHRYLELTDSPSDPERVPAEDAPVMANTYTGEDVDVSHLPLVTHNERDGGPYIDAGVVFARDPDTGTYNAGIYRAQLHGPRKLGLFAGPSQDLGRLCRKMADRDEPLEVVMAVGTHPMVTIGSTARLAYDENELRHISGLFDEAVGSPMRTVAAETVDLEAPAHSEFLIEGTVPPGEMEPEGPFGEFPWTYGAPRDNPVIEIDAISRRDDPIHETIFAAHPDHNLCGVLGVEGELYRTLADSVPVDDVRMPLHGCCRFTAFVSIDKQLDGQGKTAIMTALGADAMLKNVVVVDDDINVFNDVDVLYAMWSRTRMDRDAVVVPDALTASLLPSTYKAENLETAIDWMDPDIAETQSDESVDNLDVKFGMDATKPVSTQWPTRPEPSDWESIDVADYLGDTGPTGESEDVDDLMNPS